MLFSLLALSGAWPPLPDGIYLPTVEIGVAPPGAAKGGAAPVVLDPAVDSLIVDEAVMRARNAGSRALLVMYRDRLQIERYFGADESDTLLPAGLVSRPLAAMAAGVALAEGRLSSLDVPVARYLHEWEGEARGAITLRQLLEDTSGLETGGDTRTLLDGFAWTDLARLPRFATNPGVRLLLGNDLESAALGFQLDHEPGGFHNVSPANTQLIAVIIERATGMPYERFLEERVWRPAGAGVAQLQLDRRAGMPAAHCCWRAAARDTLRIVSLLASDGMTSGARVLPAGWAARDGSSLARQRRHRHAATTQRDRKRRVPECDGRGWQRVLGGARDWPRHRQHCRRRRRQRAGSARTAAAGLRSGPPQGSGRARPGRCTQCGPWT